PGVNIVLGRNLPRPALTISNPPVFNGQSDHMLRAFVINGILSHGAFHNERKIFADLALLQEVLMFSHFFHNENIFDYFNLVFGKWNGGVIVNISDKRIVHGASNASKVPILAGSLCCVELPGSIFLLRNYEYG